MDQVFAKRRLIPEVSGVAEKNADLVEIEPFGEVHVTFRLSRVVQQPVLIVANGGCGFIVESADGRHVLGDVPLLRWGGAAEDREAGRGQN